MGRKDFIAERPTSEVMYVAGLEVLVTSMGGLCTAEEVAGMVVFPCSEGASFVTGAPSAMDGSQRKAIMDTSPGPRLLSGVAIPVLHVD